MQPVCATVASKEVTEMPFRILDLPTELIDSIVEHIYIDGSELPQAIIPTSLTCKALRRATKPRLFATLTIETQGYYLNNKHTSSGRHHDQSSTLIQVLPSIAAFVTTLRFVSWHRRHDVPHDTKTWKFPENINMLGAMSRLRAIIFDPPHAYTRGVLRLISPLNLQINFEYRNHDSPSALSMFDPDTIADHTWAVTCSNGHQGAIEVARGVCSRLKAIQWSYPTNRLARDDHIGLLKHLKSATMLQELHLSEKVLDLNEDYARNPTCSPQLCDFMSTLPNLRRCRIEGNDLTKDFLAILPNLSLLEDLSIYSVYRRVFHAACDLKEAEGAAPESTVDMPWLKLPKLRSLDLRYICKHFNLSQLVPPGLKALRIEFFGRDERVGLQDLDWLIHNCAGLERLELDLGSLVDFDPQAKVLEASSKPSPSSHLLSLLRKLCGFRRLRILRLFPTYWHQEKLLSNPFANDSGVASAVKVFSEIRSVGSNICTMIICISFGEYPFGIVPRMSLSTRPIKYLVRAVDDCKTTVVRWSYAASDECFEMPYEGDTALSSFRTISVSPKTFFDDLDHDWILPHYELD